MSDRRTRGSQRRAAEGERAARAERKRRLQEQAAARQRKRRQRLAHDLVQLTVEINELDLQVLLHRHDLLEAHQAEDRAAMRRGLQRLLEALCSVTV
jgi:hypothetical protein